eukprot:8144494-Pyramimonas_sp.AAC.1
MTSSIAATACSMLGAPLHPLLNALAPRWLLLLTPSPPWASRSNVGPAKTALLVAFRGPGSVVARKQFWIEEEGEVSIPPTYTFPEGLSLEAVQSCQHLGWMASDKQDMAPELAYR